MYSEGELGIHFCCGLIQIRALHPPARSPKTSRQGGRAIRIPKGREETPNLIGAMMGVADDAQGGSAINPA